MRTLYLCGAINGCTDSEAKDWREAVKSRLAGRYNFLDPMRRDYRGREDESVSEIVALDIADIADSDVVLVAADRPSWGTAMECFYAFQSNKHVVIVCAGPRVSPWLRYHSSRLYPTLNDALVYLEATA